MMCKTNLRDSNYCDNVIDNPEAGPRDNTDGHRPRSGLGITDPIHLLSAQATCLSGVNFVAETGSHVTKLGA